MTRKGGVAYVVVGDNKHILIPDLTTYRLGTGRLKGLRCIHTHLNSEPISREDVTDLVLLGLDLMGRAGFDPRQSVELWKNMARASRGQPPEFLSTHPSHDTRIRDLEARIPSAMQLRDAARAQGKSPSC